MPGGSGSIVAVSWHQNRPGQFQVVHDDGTEESQPGTRAQAQELAESFGFTEEAREPDSEHVARWVEGPDLFTDDPVQTVLWMPQRGSDPNGHTTISTVAGRRFYAALTREEADEMAGWHLGATKVETVSRRGRVEWSRGPT